MDYNNQEECKRIDNGEPGRAEVEALFDTKLKKPKEMVQINRNNRYSF
jgi:hypothetical protein